MKFLCLCIFQEEKDGFENSYNTHSKLEVHGDYGVLRATDLKHRIAELVRIKSNENCIYILYIFIPNVILKYKFIIIIFIYHVIVWALNIMLFYEITRKFIDYLLMFVKVFKYILYTVLIWLSLKYRINLNVK